VQGVGFRYFAVRAARRLELVGTVSNLPDGSVEALVEGSVDDITSFRAELERGPSFAFVTAVEESEIPLSGRYTSFDVAY
jgi:acylphosphatase